MSVLPTICRRYRWSVKAYTLFLIYQRTKREGGTWLNYTARWREKDESYPAATRRIRRWLTEFKVLGRDGSMKWELLNPYLPEDSQINTTSPGLCRTHGAELLYTL